MCAPQLFYNKIISQEEKEEEEEKKQNKIVYRSLERANSK